MVAYLGHYYSQAGRIKDSDLNNHKFNNMREINNVTNKIILTANKHKVGRNKKNFITTGNKQNERFSVALDSSTKYFHRG